VRGGGALKRVRGDEGNISELHFAYLSAVHVWEESAGLSITTKGKKGGKKKKRGFKLQRIEYFMAFARAGRKRRGKRKAPSLTLLFRGTDGNEKGQGLEKGKRRLGEWGGLIA